MAPMKAEKTVATRRRWTMGGRETKVGSAGRTDTNLDRL